MWRHGDPGSARLGPPRPEPPVSVYTPFLPGDESLALKKGPTPVVAPAGKFRSGIRILQVSTGKPTTTREHSCQFGETSYSILFLLFGFLMMRNQSGDRVRGRSWASHPVKSLLRRISVLLALFVRVPEQSGSGGTRPPIPPKGRGPRSSSSPSLAG